MRNIDVIQSWARGRRARSSNGNLSTDGVRLYSYNLPIAIRGCGGQTLLHDHTAGGRGFVSMTTSHHVNLAKPYSDEIG